MALLRPERADILVVFALAVVIGLLLLATPIAVQAIVNSVALGGQIQPLVTVALVLMLMLGLAAVLYCAQTWTVELLSASAVRARSTAPAEECPTRKSFDSPLASRLSE